MSTTSIRIVNASIVIRGRVDGNATVFVLDTGDAVGPVFNQSDAFRLGLPEGPQEGVSGAGGAASVYSTTANIEFDGLGFGNEPCAIDPGLQGPSLLGLPFFLKKCRSMSFDFEARTLTLEPKQSTPSSPPEVSVFDPVTSTTTSIIDTSAVAPFPAEPTS